MSSQKERKRNLPDITNRICIRDQDFPRHELAHIVSIYERIPLRHHIQMTCKTIGGLSFLQGQEVNEQHQFGHFC